jgi:group I intron endonuclease
MTLLNSLFEANTLKDLLKACDDMYTREAVEALTEFFTGTTPTLREVCDTTVDYCNANELPLNDNVYLMTAPNDKKYIGQTANLVVRMRHYRNKRGSNPHWKSALKIYGFENFTIEHYTVPTMCADIIEKFAILWYDLTNREKGYNKTSGGKNGFMMSAEIRAKIGDAHRGVPKSAEAIAAQKASWTQKRRIAYGDGQRGEKNHMFGKGWKVSGENNPFFGQKHTKESIEKMTGENAGLFGRFGKNHPKFGKKETILTRTKKSIARVGKKDSEETRARKRGNKNGIQRRVVVDGMLFTTAKEASEKMNKNKAYVSLFISKNKESTDIFKVSEEFYADCMRKNIDENITREMNEKYYYFL